MRTLVVGAAIVDLMMKVERLPKSGEDIPRKQYWSKPINDFKY